jgi:hypothetical protein
MSIILAALLAMQSGPSCAAAGRSTDQDPAGLNVRAAPSAGARIVGRLFSVAEPEAHHGGWPPRYGPIFWIRGARDGWVRIDGAAAEVEGADGEVRRNYTGPGWVSANHVEATIVMVGTGDPARQGYARPDFAAGVADPHGLTNIERMQQTLRRPARVVACSGPWVQLDYVRMGRTNADGQWREFPASERTPARAWFRSGAPGE